MLSYFFGALLLVVITIYSTKWFFSKRQKEKFDALEKATLQIKVSRVNEKPAKVAESIYAALHSTTVTENYWSWLFGSQSPRFSFEIATIHQQIYFYIWTPKVFEQLITAQLYAQYPDIEITPIVDYAMHSNHHIDEAVCAELTTTDPYIVPIKRSAQFEDKTSLSFLDPLSGITTSFATLENIEQLWAQIVVQPIDSPWRHRGMWAYQKIRGGFRLNSAAYSAWYTNMLLERGWIKRFINFCFVRPALFMVGLGPMPDDGGMKDDVQASHDKETTDHAVQGKLAQLGFKTNIRFVYVPAAHNKPFAEQKLQELAASFYQFNQPRFNSFALRIINERNKFLLRRYRNREMVNPFILSKEEMATIWHLPNETVTTPSIQWVQSRKLEAPQNLPTKYSEPDIDLTNLGVTNFRGHRKLFGIKPDDRRRHMYIIGKTGMGKSTILENMLASDIEMGRGVAVVDPHGDLAESVLDFIPKNRSNDVVVFNPGDTDFPMSFNMLECRNPAQRHLIASGLLGVFKKMFGDSWGPRLEHILRNTILALVECPGSTMLGIMKMLTDPAYRKSVVAKVTDPMVKSFWEEEFGSWQPKQVTEAVAPIQNKVGQFLSSPLIRNIFGQPKSSVDLRFFMDKKKIVIINLSKGKIGEDNSSLLGSMFITKFQLDAMSRADQAEKDRIDFYLYVDEFQNFATDSFATILSEARKYKLNLTMANQYIDQMSDEVKAAVFGNVGSIVACQVGAEDAEIFAKQFAEQILPMDIINLPKYKCYTRLMIDGMSSNTFSADTLPPPIRKEDILYADHDTVVKISRERYAKKRDFVEDKIGQWMDKPK